MSEIQTKNWLNKSEEEVISKLGQSKRKEILESGYKLLFDFSTYRVPYNSNYRPSSPSYNVVDNQGRRIGTQTNTNTVTTSYANPLLETVSQKVLEFYFDNNKKVSYVFALGYPDSIRYELRRK
ncbi:MAG: hypothetical protein NT153_12860 [Bacteroidetes bacterium]|nr:hypothetical protein [Bacteroidota bacterium]